MEVGSGKGPAVEAETPSDAQTTVEPAKNAFLPDKDDPPPAPKSSAGDAEMFKQAEAAHSSAEKKEEAEHTQLEQVKETEPTNVPGAELPAALVADQVENKVEEEINREAPVPLEEAAPTPSSETSTEAVPIASKADTQEKAGAQIVRNAEAEVNERGEKLAHNAKAKAEEDVDAVKPDEVKVDAAEEAAVAQRPLVQEEVEDLKKKEGAAAAEAKADLDGDARMDPVPPRKPGVLRKQKAAAPADADELAALEERERFRKGEKENIAVA